ncbi:MAG: LamG-like jellyroll fold domain-containing protein [Solirubrobacterales bacterium]
MLRRRRTPSPPTPSTRAKAKSPTTPPANTTPPCRAAPNGRAANYGSALQFNGYYEECAKAADAPDLQLPEEFTLEAWVKPTGSGESEPILFKETKYTTGYSLYFGEFEDGHLEGIIGEPGYEFAAAEDPEPMPHNVWTHVALTFDGARMRLYRDGALVDTAAAQGAQPTTGPLSIGCSKEFHDGYRGKIDELRIYNRALGAEEVGGDESAPIETPQAGPVAAYPFDQGEGTTAADTTGNEHDASLEGGAEWTERGKYGSALHFDGADDCLTVEDSPDLQLREEFTLETWVKPEGKGEAEWLQSRWMSPAVSSDATYFFEKDGREAGETVI